MCSLSAVTASCSRAPPSASCLAADQLAVDGRQQQHRQRRGEHEGVKRVAAQLARAAADRRSTSRCATARWSQIRSATTHGHKPLTTQLQRDRQNRVAEVADAVADCGDQRSACRPTPVQISAPASSGERPRRAKAPITSASSGEDAHADGEQAEVCERMRSPPATAPNHGPKRIAIGRVTMRPSSSGATDPCRHGVERQSRSGRTGRRWPRRLTVDRAHVSRSPNCAIISRPYARAHRRRRSRHRRDPRPHAPALELQHDPGRRRRASVGTSARRRPSRRSRSSTG